MKCEIAQDLLTLYAEDLCSPDTASELEAHLTECAICSQKLTGYKSEITKNLTPSEPNASENFEKIKPLKKVKKKLIHRKWLAIILGLLLLLLLSVIGYLSYGQVTNSNASFSVLADIYKLNKVTKAFAEGDTKPLIDILSFTYDEIYTIENVTDFDSFDDYKNYLKERLDEIYNKDLKGKELTVKLASVLWGSYDEMYSIDSPVTAYCYDFYDETGNLVLSIDFNRMGPNKYNLSDYSGISEFPTNAFNREFLNYLLPNENVVTNVLLQYQTRKIYEANMSAEAIEHPGWHIAMLIRYYDPETDAEKAEEYKAQLEEKIANLYEEGIYFKDALYTIDTFDMDTGHWVYKVLFEVENQSNGESCMLEYRFNYYNYRLYVIPDETVEIISSDVLTEEQTNQLLTLFDK